MTPWHRLTRAQQEDVTDYMNLRAWRHERNAENAPNAARHDTYVSLAEAWNAALAVLRREARRK